MRELNEAQSESESLQKSHLSGRKTGRWTKEEHLKFLQGLKKYGKNWKQVGSYIGTRTGTQIRSHAQKYFNRKKKETGAHCREPNSNDEDEYASVLNMARSERNHSLIHPFKVTKVAKRHRDERSSEQVSMSITERESSQSQQHQGSDRDAITEMIHEELTRPSAFKSTIKPGEAPRHFTASPFTSTTTPFINRNEAWNQPNHLPNSQLLLNQMLMDLKSKEMLNSVKVLGLDLKQLTLIQLSRYFNTQLRQVSTQPMAYQPFISQNSFTQPQPPVPQIESCVLSDPPGSEELKDHSQLLQDLFPSVTPTQKSGAMPKDILNHIPSIPGIAQ